MTHLAIIEDIRANLRSYSDEDFRVLRGRLTLNMYGPEVSDALADEVIAESRRRRALAKLEADRAAADAWLEENAHAMVEDRQDEALAYGAEYFDLEALSDDADDLDYYEFMGLRAASQAKRTVYVDTGIKTATAHHPRDTGHNDGHVRYLAPVVKPTQRADATALAYRGQPIVKYSASCERAATPRLHTMEQKALAEMANKDAQKVRRYAKKEQVTISTAIDALRTAGKIAA